MTESSTELPFSSHVFIEATVYERRLVVEGAVQDLNTVSAKMFCALNA